MNYRQTQILAEQTANTAKTETIDINVTEVISRIAIRFKSQLVSAGVADHPAANVTKIELVDGSEVLFSLSGKECQAMNYYNNLKAPYNEIIGSVANWLKAVFFLDFGRFLYDPLYAFDPKQFNNPQLKITHDKAIADTSATAGKLLVTADVFDQKEVSPVGFLLNKSIHSYTGTGGTYKGIDLPTDRALRMLLCRAYVTNKAFDELIDEIRLDEDNQKRIPFDLVSEQYIRQLISDLPPMQEHFMMEVSSTPSSVYAMPTYWPHVYGALWSVYKAFKRMDYYRAERQELLIDSVTPYQFDGIIQGHIPHHTVGIMFGNQQDPDDWYNLADVGSLELRYHEVAAQTPAVSTIVQQVRPYA